MDNITENLDIREEELRKREEEFEKRLQKHSKGIRIQRKKDKLRKMREDFAEEQKKYFAKKRNYNAHIKGYNSKEILPEWKVEYDKNNPEEIINYLKEIEEALRGRRDSLIILEKTVNNREKNIEKKIAKDKEQLKLREDILKELDRKYVETKRKICELGKIEDILSREASSIIKKDKLGEDKRKWETHKKEEILSLDSDRKKWTKKKDEEILSLKNAREEWARYVEKEESKFKWRESELKRSEAMLKRNTINFDEKEKLLKEKEEALNIDTEKNNEFKMQVGFALRAKEDFDKIMEKSEDNDTIYQNKRIKSNIGGTIFETYQSTLTTNGGEYWRSFFAWPRKNDMKKYLLIAIRSLSDYIYHV